MSEYPQCEWQLGDRKQGRCWRPGMTTVNATHKDWTPYERNLCHWHKEEIICIRGRFPTPEPRRPIAVAG